MLQVILFVVVGLLSLIVVWVCEGLFKRRPPFGELADYVIGLLAGLGWAALDYYVLVTAMLGPNAAMWLRVGAALIEGPALAWLILWALRQIVRSPVKDTAQDGS